MASKKQDCILVVNDFDHLCGIVTAKDIGYNTERLHSRTSLLVSDIMTSNPICVTIDSNLQDALDLMISRGFRHVPVCSEKGEIFGLLDIKKCLYDVLDKMERVYGSSQKLIDALEGIEKEWTSTMDFTPYMASLKDRMSCPDLSTLIFNNRQHQQPIIQVSIKTHVNEVVKLMKENKTTAVLVMDHKVLAGIFTTKDIVLRVIAAGINAENCSVVRVMTPEPDTVSPQTSIFQALKKMHDGHYLNLPVLDENKNILGMIDVLSLSHATLELVNNVKGISADSDGSKFWNNITGCGGGGGGGGGDDDTLTVTETESILSSLSINSPSHLKDDTSTITTSTTLTNSHSILTQQQQEDDNRMFTFKFNHHNKTYRFRSSIDDVDMLYKRIKDKLENIFLNQEEKEKTKINIYYMDEDQDKVVMNTNSDVMESIKVARCMGLDRVRLFIVLDDSYKNKSWKDKCVTSGSQDKSKDNNNNNNKTRLPNSQAHWPMGIAFFGVIIVGVFSLSKICSRL
ncbi:hypothetical protein BJ944DRAFT_170441 [Cunninghamella echinulata]|nr:hypothetical protein BJ944DRAFT_170441 [Cunninghamella echinulata]